MRAPPYQLCSPHPVLCLRAQFQPRLLRPLIAPRRQERAAQCPRTVLLQSPALCCVSSNCQNVSPLVTGQQTSVLCCPTPPLFPLLPWLLQSYLSGPQWPSATAATWFAAAAATPTSPHAPLPLFLTRAFASDHPTGLGGLLLSPLLAARATRVAAQQRQDTYLEVLMLRGKPKLPPVGVCMCVCVRQCVCVYVCVGVSNCLPLVRCAAAPRLPPLARRTPLLLRPSPSRVRGALPPLTGMSCRGDAITAAACTTRPRTAAPSARPCPRRYGATYCGTNSLRLRSHHRSQYATPLSAAPSTRPCPKLISHKSFCWNGARGRTTLPRRGYCTLTLSVVSLT